MVVTPPASPTGEVDAHFAREPRALPLYRAVESTILATFPEARVDVQRTQITFRLKRTPGRERTLAAVWLPPHRVAGRPEVYVVLTLGLRRRLDDPRIIEAVEPHPGNWTHHVLIARPEDMDEQVMGWLREAAEQ
ncbi:MAG: hypothetical protein GX557_10120 [Chloroflexi bacterium]|nr:hypothetical protein [Chloroflexota bacterium]